MRTEWTAALAIWAEEEAASRRSADLMPIEAPAPLALAADPDPAPEAVIGEDGGEPALPAGISDAGAPEPSSSSLAADDPPAIDYAQLLLDRPDVLQGFYEAYHGPNNDRNSDAWRERVGEATPEAYAKYWYAEHGRFEGYAQGPTTAQDTISLERILIDRPDVLRSFYEEFYGSNNDRDSDAWTRRVGGETPEAYAKYWYEKHGRWEGYAQTDKAAAEAINVERLLSERPDVFRAYFEQFYGPENDRKSSAWVDRVGGDTVEDYAKYWYVAHGRREGYTQRSSEDAPGWGGGTFEPPPLPDVHDPAEDPWNHPAIFPDWRPPYEGWEPPPNIWHGGDTDAADATTASASLFDPDPFG